MEHIPHAEMREHELPQEAPVLADWIDEELGDEELAQFLRDHPEGTELLANGECLLPRTVFELARDMASVNEEEAGSLILHFHEQGILPQVSTERIVGNIGDKSKEHEHLGQEFYVALRRLELESGEMPKQEYELAMIKYANTVLDEIRARYDMPKFQVLPEAVRLTDEVPFMNKAATGEFFQYEQEMHSSPEEHPVNEMSVVVHELTHFKSYGAMMIDAEEDGTVKQSTYRVGMNIWSRDGRVKYLTGLNEAVTEETANRIMRNLPEDHPVLGALAKNLHTLSKIYSEKNPDILARERLQPHWLIPSRKKPSDPVSLVSAYQKERVLMGDLFAKIQERNPAHFGEKTKEEAHEELFEMLQKAMFTGNILPFGKLFNDTFGKGKFREYGHLQTLEEQEEFVRNL